jgi:hypothetical protein
VSTNGIAGDIDTSGHTMPISPMQESYQRRAMISSATTGAPLASSSY